MKRLLTLSALLVLMSRNSSASPPPECCKDGHRYVFGKKHCSDNTPIPLNCSFFLYDLDSDDPNEVTYNFTLDEKNASWAQFYGLSRYNISPDSYCLTKNESMNNWMMVCFEDSLFNYGTQQWFRYVLIGPLSVVSTISLAIALIVYLVLPELREIQDKAIICMMLSFMVSYLLTSVQHMSYNIKDDFICGLVAFSMYYSYMASFFWLNVISLNIWRSVWYPDFKVRNNVLFAFYSIIGWGIPLCFLMISLISHYDKDHSFITPGFGERSCWFSSRTATWTYFYGPILALLSVNILYLTLTTYKLWREYKDLNNSRMKSLRVRCMLCVKVGLTMGITWIFEILSFAVAKDEHYHYWILADIVNVLQGLVMFVILVTFRQRVRILLAQRRPFNIPFPKYWAAYEDLENCDDDDNEQTGHEELKLSQ